MVKTCQELSIFESSREFSFYAHVLLENQVSIGEDTRQSDIFFDNPLVSSKP